METPICSNQVEEVAGPLQVGWALKGVVLELRGVANEKAVGGKDLHQSATSKHQK